MRFRRLSLLSCLGLTLLAAGCFLPDQSQNYTVFYSAVGPQTKQVVFQFNAVLDSPLQTAEVSAVNGEPIDSGSSTLLTDIADALNYKAVDHRETDYETTCQLISEATGQSECQVEMTTGQLKSLLCSVVGWLKISIPNTNTIQIGEKTINITDQSAEIRVSQIVPGQDQADLKENCPDIFGSGVFRGMLDWSKLGGLADLIAEGDAPPNDDPPDDPPPPEPAPGGGAGGAEIQCAEVCAAGFTCNTQTGTCEAAAAQGNLCSDVACGNNQYCDTETGLCEDFSSGDFSGGSDDDDSNSGSSSDGGLQKSSNQNQNKTQNNPLACALNPAQCSDTKGWCALNPNLPFQPWSLLPVLLLGFILIVILSRRRRISFKTHKIV